MKYEILPCNTFTLAPKFHCVCLSSIKDCVYREKISSEMRKFNSIDFDGIRKPSPPPTPPLSPWKIPTRKIPPGEFPPGIFPPRFLTILFFHYDHRY